MRCSIGPISIAFLAFSAAAVVEAQEAADKYVLLATERTGTMQREIDDAAAKGFRVFGASPNDGSEVIIFLEKSNDKYQYRLVAATRIETLQREMSEAAGDGYHIVPRAVTRKGDELLVLMEKGPGGPARSQYRVLATERTATLQKEIAETANDGFSLIAVAKTGEHIAILERRAP
jgi:hypothetical protein